MNPDTVGKSNNLSTNSAGCSEQPLDPFATGYISDKSSDIDIDLDAYLRTNPSCPTSHFPQSTPTGSRGEPIAVDLSPSPPSSPPPKRRKLNMQADPSKARKGLLRYFPSITREENLKQNQEQLEQLADDYEEMREQAARKARKKTKKATERQRKKRARDNKLKISTVSDSEDDSSSITVSINL